mgnify:CR=1 FL=1
MEKQQIKYERLPLTSDFVFKNVFGRYGNEDILKRFLSAVLNKNITEVVIQNGELPKEEKDKTAEFLLTHPISRTRVITEKLIAVILQIVVMNGIILGLALLSMVFIGEEIPMKEVLLMHLAYFLLQIELAGICFGISAFSKRGSMGIGLGLAIMMYFLNLIANMTESAEVLKYITPFAYCDGADIVENGTLDITLVAIGMCLATCGVAIAYAKYTKKDIG